MGGWQTGNFADGWHEWNDRYRDRVRNFWLSDVDYARAGPAPPPVGIGGFAHAAGRLGEHVRAERGPLASINFVTAHDGFTLADLVSYDVKHNLGNGEHNRDGTDTNSSFNHGVEGPTDDPSDARDAAARPSATCSARSCSRPACPMLTAGDEFGRTPARQQQCLLPRLRADVAVVGSRRRGRRTSSRTCSACSRCAARTRRCARCGSRRSVSDPERLADGLVRRDGETMSIERWRTPQQRTLQYVAASTPEHRGVQPHPARGAWHERPIDVTLPEIDGVTRYVSLWSSTDERPTDEDGVLCGG